MALAERLGSSGHWQPLTVYKIPYTAADFADNSEVELADLPSEGIVTDVVNVVTTAEATATTKTLDAGMLSSESGGDADGFHDGVSVAAAGVIQASLANGANTYGALLREQVGGAGVNARANYVLDGTPNSFSATFGDAGGANELAGYFLVYVRHDPTNGNWNSVNG